jgi:hypothetical protein
LEGRFPSSRGTIGLSVVLFVLPSLRAQPSPFFVAYSHHLEATGDLEVSLKSIGGESNSCKPYVAAAIEFEYGARDWWTSALYIDGQGTVGERASLTGYRWENRLRVLPHEHWINPVLYLEYESVNRVDSVLLEIVNHDGDRTGLSNGLMQPAKKRELEGRLILGSHFEGITIAENFIVDRNIRYGPLDFGYAIGLSRQLTVGPPQERCRFCPENFQVGVEVYGGLGSSDSFGLPNTSHYLAPTASWMILNGTILFISPTFGVSASSTRLLLRIGISHEVDDFGRSIRNLFRSVGRHRS